MATSYPDEVSTFKVIGRLVRGVIDSNDPGQEPDMLPLANAEVSFTPDLNPPVFRVPSAFNSAIVFLETITAVTDAEGYLIAPDDPERGVVLPYGFSPEIIPTGWTWRVRIRVGGNFPDKIFSIMGDPINGVDLADVIPVPANPGRSLGEWVAAVKTVEAARKEAVASAVAAKASETNAALSETNAAASASSASISETSAASSASAAQESAQDARNHSVIFALHPTNSDLLVAAFPTYLLRPDGNSIRVPVEVS